LAVSGSPSSNSSISPILPTTSLAFHARCITLHRNSGGAGAKTGGLEPLIPIAGAATGCGYVPNCFCKGIIVPRVKDKSADITDINNYRGITLSSVIAKVLEMCLVELLSDYLQTSVLQFGFKKQLGCSNAIYALSSVIEFFTKNGSTINACFLDLSKAFDKVNHYDLHLKLMKRVIPHMLLNVIINWYGKCSVMVRWESSLSRCFLVTCSVRQGGVLSPFLFAIYVDDVIVSLQDKRLGCFVGGSYIGCLIYADDCQLH